ncbi:MAG: sulfotransferase [Pseudomonadota bacterium]
MPHAQLIAAFDRPIIVVAAPRSGSTMLYELLSKHPDFWTLGGEGHAHIEGVKGLKPDYENRLSNRLKAENLTNQTGSAVLENFLLDMRDDKGRMLKDMAHGPNHFRFLEKTPKNALRIPFFDVLFKEARFVWLQRAPRGNISSIIDAWRSGKFVTYRDLPGWRTLPWSLALIEEWPALKTAPLGLIATQQWLSINNQIAADLRQLPANRWLSVRYEDVLADTPTSIKRILDFAEVDPKAFPQEALTGTIAPSQYTLTAPDKEKWRRNAPDMAPHFADVDAATALFEEMIS